MRPFASHYHNRRPGGVSAAVLLVAAMALLRPPVTTGQERAGAGQHSHDEQNHHRGLHFSHPLVTESVSPDTKIRLDHRFFRFPDDHEEHSGALEAEYAFHRSFSIEAGIPYSYTDAAFGNLELALKFANYAFEDRGLLLGYGLELGFPTNGEPEAEGSAEADRPRASLASHPEVASRIRPRFSSADGGAGVGATLGSDEYELAPFLNVGFRSGNWELVGWMIFEIPFNQEDADDIETELSYDLSVLFAVSPRLQALVELNGSSGISGHAVGEDVVSIAPGVKFRPLAGRPLFLGVSVGFPVTDDELFDARLVASAFWHLES